MGRTRTKQTMVIFFMALMLGIGSGMPDTIGGIIIGKAMTATEFAANEITSGFDWASTTDTSPAFREHSLCDYTWRAYEHHKA